MACLVKCADCKKLAIQPTWVVVVDQFNWSDESVSNEMSSRDMNLVVYANFFIIVVVVIVNNNDNNFFFFFLFWQWCSSWPWPLTFMQFLST